MAGDGDAILAGAGNRGDEIDHPNLVNRRLLVPRLFDDRHPDGGQLIFDVLAGLLDGRRPGRPRPERHQLPQMVPRAAGIEARRLRRLQQERQRDQELHARFSRGT